MLRLTLLLLCCLLAGPAAARDLTGTVNWVYDGDTLKIKNIGKVRLLGIDTPESKASGRDRYYQKNFNIPPSRLRRIAREVKTYNIKHVKGRKVRLRFDTEKTDKYGRILAYVYLPGGRMLNRVLLEKGLASVFRRYQFQHKNDFLRVEKKAQRKKRGLWKE